MLNIKSGASCLLIGSPGFKWCFPFAHDLVSYFGAQGFPSSGSCESSFLIHHGLVVYLFVFGDSLIS